MLLRTSRTFLVVRAISAARAFSDSDFAKPDSCTVPFRVSTLMEVAETLLSSAILAFTAVVMPASSTYEPTVCWSRATERSEEHTSELQSPDHLVCRLLLEKKKFTRITSMSDCQSALLHSQL